MADRAEERSLQDIVLDIAVYAPVGIIVTVFEEFPKFTSKGKERVASQIQMARVIGKFTVGEAQRRIDRLATSQAARGTLGGSQAAALSPAPAVDVTLPGGDGDVKPTLDHLNGDQSAATRSRGASALKAGTTPSAPPGSPRRAVADAEAASPLAQLQEPASSAVPSTTQLAVPGYDTLAASQVVQRLSSLRPGELEAIRLYEVSTRGRRTILHRIAQLTDSTTLGSSAAPPEN